MEQSTITLSLENVTFGFNGTELFKGIDLRVFQGEIFAIVGTSGSGTSTFLKLCIGLLKPQQGVIRIYGIDITTVSFQKLNEIRLRIGFVFQDGGLISNMTLFENVALPLRYHTSLYDEAIRDIAEGKLSLVEISGYEGYFPAQLSMEYKIRAGLARALALDPMLIFYDEPAAGLDEDKSNSLLRLIKRLRDEFGVTSVVVSHNMDFATSIADRIAVIGDGRMKMVGENPDTELSAQME